MIRPVLIATASAMESREIDSNHLAFEENEIGLGVTIGVTLLSGPHALCEKQAQQDQRRNSALAWDAKRRIHRDPNLLLLCR